MDKILKWALLTLVVALLPFNAKACDNDDSDGLDVALVLSGGGAKASTQVGVMQLMDELDIPVHCITGTSMGGVVGSFYATGYDANEIADMLTSRDWGEIFRGQVPRRDKSFIEKEREANYFSGNIASLSEGGVNLPGGLASMQGLKSYYRDILSHIPLNSDFDSFNIPFRAVATNLSTGEAKAFGDGDLVEAILASMAVPGLFSPREIEGEVYVDGGLSSTLPVQLAKDLGADIIIALDVSEKPERKNHNVSIAATANQITGIVIWRTREAEVAKLTSEDLLILPNTIGIGTSAYDRSEEGLKAGRALAESYREQLLAIKSKAAPAKPRKIRKKRLSQDMPIKVANNSRVKTDLIETRFDYKNNPPETSEEIQSRLRNLASFGGFGEVDLGYSNGEAILTVNENSMGRNLAQIGLNATSDFSGNSTYSILARLTRKPLGSNGGDLSLSSEFGTNIGLSAELYQPFGPRARYFIQPELFATWEEQKFDVVDQRVADFWISNVGVRGRLGREIGTWGVIALDGELRSEDTSVIVNIGEPSPGFSQNIASLGAYIAADTLNRNDWPTAGQRMRARLSRTYSLDVEEDARDRIDASFLQAFNVGDYNFLLNARYGEVDIGDDPTTDNILELIDLGGFRQLTSVRDNALPVERFEYISAEIFNRVSSEGKLLDMPMYVGGLIEYANIKSPIIEEDETLDVISGSLYFGVDTPLGPFFLGAAYGINEELQMFFKFGRTF